jgi:hypothetical protein
MSVLLTIGVDTKAGGGFVEGSRQWAIKCMPPRLLSLICCDQQQVGMCAYHAWVLVGFAGWMGLP